MADSDKDVVAPLPPNATSSVRHRRVASASADLGSNQSRTMASTSEPFPAVFREDGSPDTRMPSAQPQLHRSSSSSALPKTIKRGKDWESEKNHPDKIAERAKVFEKRKQFEPDVPIVRAKAKKEIGGVSLGYSEISQQTIEPHYPESVTPGPPDDPEPKLESAVGRSGEIQSARNLQANEAALSPSTPPDEDERLKGVSAFEYAMCQWLDSDIDHVQHYHKYLETPAREDKNLDTYASSPRLQPRRDDEMSYTSSAQDEGEDDVSEVGIPSHVERADPFRTQMRRVKVRTHLMRCSILLSIVHEHERKPWAEDSEDPPYYYYSKMRKQAETARKLAEALESNDLRARCEYWAGRGCGGTKDYGAAMQHFRHAVNLDVPNDKYPNGKTRFRGLRPAEKADVDFLLKHASERHEDWMNRTVDQEWYAQDDDEDREAFLRARIDPSGPESPAWMPDGERVTRLAAKDDIRSKLGENIQNKGDLNSDLHDRELEAKLQAQYAVKGIDPERTRRLLSRKEWKYIEHGDPKEAQRRKERESDARLEASRPFAMARSTSLVDAQAEEDGKADSAHQPLDPEEKTARPVRTLDKELEPFDWDSDSDATYSDDEASSTRSIPRTASPERRTPSPILKSVG